MSREPSLLRSGIQLFCALLLGRHLLAVELAQVGRRSSACAPSASSSAWPADVERHVVARACSRHRRCRRGSTSMATGSVTSRSGAQSVSSRPSGISTWSPRREPLWRGARRRPGSAERAASARAPGWRRRLRAAQREAGREGRQHEQACEQAKASQHRWILCHGLPAPGSGGQESGAGAQGSGAQGARVQRRRVAL